MLPGRSRGYRVRSVGFLASSQDRVPTFLIALYLAPLNCIRCGFKATLGFSRSLPSLSEQHPGASKQCVLMSGDGAKQGQVALPIGVQPCSLRTQLRVPVLLRSETDDRSRVMLSVDVE